MARTDYSVKLKGETIARGKANEIPVSPKHSIEITNFIRNKLVNDAISELHDVVAQKRALPFRTFNKKIPHRRGLVGWDAGRYPKKATLAVIKLLESVKKNAEYSGLETEKLQIVHAAANRGRAHRSFFPRAMGRATPKVRETVNIEIIVKEVE
jgi:large subunit ribosomal protein L22